MNGLKGVPEAIEAIFPQTVVQTCIVHLIRHSLEYVPRRRYDQVVKDLRPIHTAVDADAAQAALEGPLTRNGANRAGDHQGLAEQLGIRGPGPGVPG